MARLCYAGVMKRFLFATLFILTTLGAHAGPSMSGRLLVSSPDMRDPNFEESVLLIVEHDASGAFGLVLNRVLGQGALGDLLDGFGIDASGMDPAAAAKPVMLRQGGPVQPSLVFVLHSTDFESESSEPVIEGVALSRSEDVLKALAVGEGPRSALFVIGYSGWAPGQLDREIARGDWLDAPAAAVLVFGSSPDDMWRNVMDAAGLSL